MLRALEILALCVRSRCLVFARVSTTLDINGKGGTLFSLAVIILPQSSFSPLVILNLFQDNKRRLCVILKQVQDDE